MKSIGELRDDDRGIMIFALLGIVIILISTFAGSYYIQISQERQKSELDLEEIKEIERDLKNIERELESSMKEAGYKAVEEVRDSFSLDDSGLDLLGLKREVGEKTNEIFERHFEKHYGDGLYSRGEKIDLDLIPVQKYQSNIELQLLYLEEKEDEWREVPGFFNVNRKFEISFKNDHLGSNWIERREIESEVETDLFLLAERINDFDPGEIRNVLNNMLFSYLNLNLFIGGSEGDLGFNRSFSEIYDTDWLDEYKGDEFDFQEISERDTSWIEGSDDSLSYFRRDEGNVTLPDFLNEEDLTHMIKLALILEQMRVFRDYDDALMKRVADHFWTTEEEILDMIYGDEVNNVNVQNLIVRLVLKRRGYDDHLSFSDLFLRGLLEEDILSVVEEWEAPTIFGLIKNLISGDVDGEGPWAYDNYSTEINDLDDISTEKSYLRTLISIYANSMDDLFISFNVDSEEVEELTEKKISEIEYFPGMNELEIIGEEGIDQMTKSILDQVSPLSESLGFESGSFDQTSHQFYYMYFVNDWGYKENMVGLEKPSDEIDADSVFDLVNSKVRNELRNRRSRLESEFTRTYDDIYEKIEKFNETEWYEGASHDEVWGSLNQTKEPLENLNENDLFSSAAEKNVSTAFEEYHADLEDAIEDVEENKQNLINGSAIDHVEKILGDAENFTGLKWRCEVIYHLLELKEGSGCRKDFLTVVDDHLSSSEDITGSYNLSLKEYSLSEDIDIPPDHPDQSIGYKALGHFVEDLRRDFTAPMDYTNSYQFFDLIKENVFDLAFPRDGYEKSRFRHILDEGKDPFSTNLDDSEDISNKNDVSTVPVSSRHLEEVEKSWLIDGLDKSLENVWATSDILEKRSEDLLSLSPLEEPYADYADAAYYRTANRVLEMIGEKMYYHRERMSGLDETIGFPQRTDRYAPVILLSSEEFSVVDSRKEEDRSFSRKLSLDVSIQNETPLVQIEDVSTTSIRSLIDTDFEIHEWINPFFEDRKGGYGTYFELEHHLNDFEIKVAIKGENKLVPETYPEGPLVTRYPQRGYRGGVLIQSPMPFLNEGYSPIPSFSKIDNVRFERNVFNGSNSEMELKLEVNEPLEKDIIIDIFKRDDQGSLSSSSLSASTGLYALDRADQTKDTELEFLTTKRINSGSPAGESVKLSLELDDWEIPKEGYKKSHLIARVRTEIDPIWMKYKESLEQTPVLSEEPSFSSVPSYAESEQLFLLDERKSSYIGAFRIEDHERSTGVFHDFEMIDNIPKESWMINKDDIYYLVDFSHDRDVRSSLSGRFEAPILESHDRCIYYLDEDMSYTNLRYVDEEGKDPYSYLYKQDFLPIFMDIGINEQHLFPDHLIPVYRRDCKENWNKVENHLRGISSPLEIDQDESLFFYFDLNRFVSDGEVNYSIKRVRNRLSQVYPEHISDRGDLITLTDFNIEMNYVSSGFEKSFISSEEKRKDAFVYHSSVEKEEIENLSYEFDDFTIGEIARSVRIIGTERTEKLLNWLVADRDQNLLSSELNAFLSFDECFSRNLSEKLEVGSYKEALNSLDQKLEKWSFERYASFGITDIDDIDAVKGLKEDIDLSVIEASSELGLKPSVLQELNSSYEFVFDNDVKGLEEFADQPVYNSFIREINSKEQKVLPSLSFIDGIDPERIDIVPYSGYPPYLLLDENPVYFEMIKDNVSSELQDVLSSTLQTAKERGLSGSIVQIRTTIEYNESEEEYIYDLIRDEVENIDPDREFIDSVEMIKKDGTTIMYRHL